MNENVMNTNDRITLNEQRIDDLYHTAIMPVEKQLKIK